MKTPPHTIPYISNPHISISSIITQRYRLSLCRYSSLSIHYTLIHGKSSLNTSSITYNLSSLSHSHISSSLRGKLLLFKPHKLSYSLYNISSLRDISLHNILFPLISLFYIIEIHCMMKHCCINTHEYNLSSLL